MTRSIGVPPLIVIGLAGLACAASISGCKSRRAPPTEAAEIAPVPAPQPAPAVDGVVPAVASPDSQDLPPPPMEAQVRGISATDLIGLLKSRKELRALTLETAGSRFAGLVPAFDETAKDDERWSFEGVNDTGFVRTVTLTFLSTDTDVWTFGSVSVRLHTEDPRLTFDELRRAATAALKKPKWLDLNTRDRTAWSLGENWELVVAVLEDGTVQVRSGRAARP
ncbi:MAG: hypothetical protein H7X95_06045 [Deltaproteobacteria bacterium]|nr:hypothetical protein [Deltaproteobacteria bacterium]